MCSLITRTLAAEQDFAHWLSACRPDGILFQYQSVRAGWDGLPGSVPRGLGFVHLDWSPKLVPLADPAHDSELSRGRINLLVGPLQAYEFGVPKPGKSVAVGSYWVASKSTLGADP